MMILYSIPWTSILAGLGVGLGLLGFLVGTSIAVDGFVAAWRDWRRYGISLREPLGDAIIALLCAPALAIIAIPGLIVGILALPFVISFRTGGTARSVRQRRASPKSLNRD